MNTIEDSGSFAVRTDNAKVVEPEPTVDSLFGILKPSKFLNPANGYEVREEIIDERLGELGYNSKND